jgi:hypothetical protein
MDVAAAMAGAVNLVGAAGAAQAAQETSAARHHQPPGCTGTRPGVDGRLEAAGQ